MGASSSTPQQQEELEVRMERCSDGACCNETLEFRPREDMSMPPGFQLRGVTLDQLKAECGPVNALFERRGAHKQGGRLQIIAFILMAIGAALIVASSTSANQSQNCTTTRRNGRTTTTCQGGEAPPGIFIGLAISFSSLVLFILSSYWQGKKTEAAAADARAHLDAAVNSNPFWRDRGVSWSIEAVKERRGSGKNRRTVTVYYLVARVPPSGQAAPMGAPAVMGMPTNGMAMGGQPGPYPYPGGPYPGYPSPGGAGGPAVAMGIPVGQYPYPGPGGGYPAGGYPYPAGQPGRGQAQGGGGFYPPAGPGGPPGGYGVPMPPMGGPGAGPGAGGYYGYPPPPGQGGQYGGYGQGYGYGPVPGQLQQAGPGPSTTTATGAGGPSGPSSYHAKLGSDSYNPDQGSSQTQSSSHAQGQAHTDHPAASAPVFSDRTLLDGQPAVGAGGAGGGGYTYAAGYPQPTSASQAPVTYPPTGYSGSSTGGPAGTAGGAGYSGGL